MALIEFQDVTVRYGHTVLSHLNLAIERGEFVSVIGQTGSGKSTLLRLLLGSETPTEGTVIVDGKTVRHPSRDRGYVPQKYSLFPDKTVIRNIAFGPIAESFAVHRLLQPSWWKRRSAVYSEALQTLQHVGLHTRDGKKYPDQLSGGMQQRVAIAQSLMMHPRILLMDESFSALDPQTRRSMQQLIRKIWRESGTTLVFVTHNMDEAVHLGNRVLKLADAQIALDIKLPENPLSGELDAIIRRLDADHPRPARENLAEVAS